MAKPALLNGDYMQSLMRFTAGQLLDLFEHYLNATPEDDHEHPRATPQHQTPK